MRTPLRFVMLFSAVWAAASVRAADHLDAPSLTGQGQSDINDVYAFRSPQTPENTVLVVTVNPFVGVSSPRDFGTDVDYELLVDNNGDALPDITYRAQFTGAGNNQTLNLTRNNSPLATGVVGTSLAVTGGGMAQAGVFDDPFFFDLAGFRNGFQFTGTNFFAGANTGAIVLEIPSASLGGPNIGIWARTVKNGVQVDRMGRPAINTALIASARKEAFNAGTPDDDFAEFGAEVNSAITGLSNAQNAAALTGVLLPDLLTFATDNAGGFLNGRRLFDDVIDAELNLLSAGAVTGDGVNANDVAFRQTFPYLAPENIPEPSGAFLGLLGAWWVLTRSARRRH